MLRRLLLRGACSSAIAATADGSGKFKGFNADLETPLQTSAMSISSIEDGLVATCGEWMSCRCPGPLKGKRSLARDPVLPDTATVVLNFESFANCSTVGEAQQCIKELWLLPAATSLDWERTFMLVPSWPPASSFHNASATLPQKPPATMAHRRKTRLCSIAAGNVTCQASCAQEDRKRASWR